MEASWPGTVMCTETLEVVHSSLLPAVPLLRGLSDSPASVITWKISIILGTQLDGMARLSFNPPKVDLPNKLVQPDLCNQPL